MARWPEIRKRLAAYLPLVLLSTLLLTFGTATPAHAGESPCQQGGVYVLWARGSGQPFNDGEARGFKDYVTSALNERHIEQIEWAEVGNIDENFNVGGAEYPAVPVDDWNAVKLLNPWYYANSVERGRNEIVAHLNDRYAGNGPDGNGACIRETLILGGYSQGADALGWALRTSELSQAAKDHIGYAALYGDPKFDPGPGRDRFERRNFQSKWWWVRGDDRGVDLAGGYPTPDYNPRDGILGARNGYVPEELKGRFGSWCANSDGICAGRWPLGMGVHSSSYEGETGWIADGARREIGWAASTRRNALNPTLLPSTTGYYDPPNSNTGPAIVEPPPPVVKSVKRRTDHIGTYQVYAATQSAVTEAWWHPGQGVQTKEMIHISQDNIVDFDKVNEPDGATQSLYTAVPDGVWETWWRPGDGPHSTKIVTGLTGVRQVIADPVTDGGQYTHRLYLLASDGPYEVWWREGGDGIHVNRLDIVNDPVTMTKSRGPDGTDQLYVATPTWVYELWWRPDTAVNHGSVINITQGDIRSLDKGANLPDGGQLLYTGTSTTAWQTYWNSANGTGISHGTITVGQNNAGQIKKTVYNGDHQLYQTNGCRVQENWWNGPSSGSSTLINISQCNITSFDKSADGPDQQVYTASGDLVYETWWRGGSNPSGPNTSVLFKVAR